MKIGEKLPGTPKPMHVWNAARGVRISADSWGDPRNPLVLLQHGGGQTRHAWKGTGCTLGRAGYYAVAFDARGHGDSDWAADGAYGTNLMVEDLKFAICALNGTKPVLVGASMGGLTSLVAIGEGHVDAAALVLVDIAPQVEQRGVDHIHAFMTHKSEGFGSLEEIAEAIARYQPHRDRPRNLAGLAKNVRLGADGRFRWHWDPRFRVEDMSPAERQNRFEACARELCLPTLLIRGGLSELVSEESVRNFLKNCPHACYENVAGAGHMVAGDRNDVFGEAIVRFLQQVVPIHRTI